MKNQRVNRTLRNLRLLILAVLFAAGCSDNGGDKSITNVSIQLSESTPSQSGVMSRPLISPSRVVGAFISVTAPDFPKPLVFTFTPDDIRKNNGLALLPVPTGRDRTFFVEALEISPTTVNNFPATIFAPNTPAPNRTFDLAGTPLFIDMDLFVAPTTTVTGTISDTRTGALQPLVPCATSRGGSVFMSFALLKGGETIPLGTTRVDVIGGIYTLLNVPDTEAFGISVTDFATGASAQGFRLPGAPSPIDANLVGAMPLAMTPSSAKILPGGAVAFNVSGGLRPYTFSLFTDTTGGAALDATTGVYMAGLSDGASRVEVSDGCQTLGANIIAFNATQCNDGIDNDADGLIDTMDTACANGTQNSELGECQDGADNDGDTFVDYPADTFCMNPWGLYESGSISLPDCGNGFDDDGDTFVDFPADPGCANSADTSENASTVCDDGLDNDGDNLVDYPWDPDCSDPADTSEGAPVSAQCNDNIDNDGDGLTDWPNDLACVGPAGSSERTPFQCDDLVDNDGDGFPDLLDPGCVSDFDPSEKGAAQCDDGIDNDADTFIDYPLDPDCASPADTTESASTVGSISGLVVDPAGNSVSVPNIWVESDVAPSTIFYSDIGTAAGSFTVIGIVPGNYRVQISATGMGVNPEWYDSVVNGSSSQAMLVPVTAGAVSNLGTITMTHTFCNDGYDNDGWGDIDWPADPGCLNVDDPDEFDPASSCDNGLDDDGDTLIDRLDPGCGASSDLTETAFTGLFVCDDGWDNDNDGLVDMQDPGCYNMSNTESWNFTNLICDNGLDDDFDTLIDFPADTVCVDAFFFSEHPLVEICGLTFDTDGDGLMGTSDPGCVASGGVSEKDPSLPCDDGIDNDGDGHFDFNASTGMDPGCLSPSDPSEKDAAGPQCDNGIDDDGDTWIDFVGIPSGMYGGDLGCADASDPLETATALMCDNGLDDDGDTLTDFAWGPGPDGQPGNAGVDDDGDTITDNYREYGWPGSDDANIGDPGCYWPNDPSELDGQTQCDNGIDDDGDTFTDLQSAGPDPQCTDPACNDELLGKGCLAQCSDGMDNDGDTLADWPNDPGCANGADTNEWL